MQNTEKTFIETLLKIVIILGVTYILYALLGVSGLIALGITFTAMSVLAYRRWKKFRQKGLIASFKQKMRTVLLQRSILDIFRDIVYFPYFTKIIGAAINIATTKPHPEQIPQILRTLPSDVYEAATKKGLLSLAPSAVQALVLPQINKQQLPANYGHNITEWDRLEQYHKIQSPVHEQTFQKRFVVFLDGKLGWVTVLIMLGGVLAGAHHMNSRKFKRMIIQNTTFTCLVLSLIAIVIKLRRQSHKKSKVNVQLVKVQNSVQNSVQI